MKKIIVSILATLYLTASTGAPISIHYCMGKLVDWSVSNDKASSCAKCGMEKKATTDSGCCSDEAKFIKNTDDQRTGATIQNLVLQAIDVPPLVSGNREFRSSFHSIQYTRANAPPLISHVPLHVLHGLFLI